MTIATQPARGLVHERAVGATVEWFTPPEVFERLGMTFDLDPCSPGAPVVPWVPATEHYTRADDGLRLPWGGRVWCNPPYGREAVPFIDKFIAHRDGILLTYARTDTRAVQRLMAACDAFSLTLDRLYFIREDGFQARGPAGSIFAAFGAESVAGLRRAGFGYTIIKRR